MENDSQTLGENSNDESKRSMSCHIGKIGHKSWHWCEKARFVQLFNRRRSMNSNKQNMISSSQKTNGEDCSARANCIEDQQL